MSILIIGKSLETLGALLVAWPLGKSALFQLRIGRHWRHNRSERNKTLEEIRKEIDGIFEDQKMFFGTSDAIISSVGLAAFIAGCTIYIVGLLQSHH